MILSSNVFIWAMVLIGIVMLVYGITFRNNMMSFTTIGAIFLGVGILGLLCPTIMEIAYNNIGNHPPF